MNHMTMTEWPLIPLDNSVRLKLQSVYLKPFNIKA